MAAAGNEVEKTDEVECACMYARTYVCMRVIRLLK